MTTVNWDKNALTRGAAVLIRAAGGEPWSTPRPFLFDDPKLFFTLFGFGGASGFSLLALLVRPRRSAKPVAYLRTWRAVSEPGRRARTS